MSNCVINAAENTLLANGFPLSLMENIAVKLGCKVAGHVTRTPLRHTRLGREIIQAKVSRVSLKGN